MKRFGVLGHPIGHSLSPFLHQAFAKQCGHTIQYDAIDTPLEAFEPTAQHFFEQGGVGLNITSPLKTRAAAWADEQDELVRILGAANTLHHENGVMKAYNTDVYGFLESLKYHQLDVAHKNILVLGAGGAARAVVYGLLQVGARVRVYNRTVEHAETLCQQFQSFGDIQPASPSILRYEGIINTLPKMMPPPFFHRFNDLSFQFGYDLNYSDKTFFQTWMESLTPLTFQGYAMLVFQAARAYSLWQRIMPATDEVLHARPQSNHG